MNNFLQKDDHQLVMPGEMSKRLRFLTASTGLVIISEGKVLPTQNPLRTRKLNVRKMQLSKHTYY